MEKITKTLTKKQWDYLIGLLNVELEILHDLEQHEDEKFINDLKKEIEG